MGNRLDVAVAVLGIVLVGVVLLASGLRYVPAVLYVYSPPICGPLKDGYGLPAGDAGPCPTPPTLPPSVEAHWEWAPFWEPPPA